MQTPKINKLLQFAFFTVGEINKATAARLREANLTFIQALFLRHLARLGDGKTMTDVARWFHHSTAAATGLVDRLEKLGYVERTHSVDDRRKVVAKITQKGLELVRGFEGDGFAALGEILGESNEPVTLPDRMLDAA